MQTIHDEDLHCKNIWTQDLPFKMKTVNHNATIAQFTNVQNLIHI
jgi:hypothetical protein